MAKKKFDDPIAQTPKPEDFQSQLEAWKPSLPNLRAMREDELEQFDEEGFDVLVISPLPPRIYKTVEEERGFLDPQNPDEKE